MTLLPSPLRRRARRVFTRRQVLSGQTRLAAEVSQADQPARTAMPG